MSKTAELRQKRGELWDKAKAFLNEHADENGMMNAEDTATYERMDEMVDTMVALRKGKMTPEECRASLAKGNYFGTMLVKMGVADALLGGATYSTADTVRPALQLVKTRKGANLVSSCFILVKEGAPMLCMGALTPQ